MIHNKFYPWLSMFRLGRMLSYRNVLILILLWYTIWQKQNSTTSLKGHQKKNSWEKMTFIRFLIFFNFSGVQKIHFLFNETKVFVVNWLKLHYKLQHLFCAPSIINENTKKCAVPLCYQWPLAQRFPAACTDSIGQSSVYLSLLDIHGSQPR